MYRRCLCKRNPTNVHRRKEEKKNCKSENEQERQNKKDSCHFPTLFSYLLSINFGFLTFRSFDLRRFCFQLFFFFLFRLFSFCVARLCFTVCNTAVVNQCHRNATCVGKNKNTQNIVKDNGKDFIHMWKS